ncbi:MAG TPA: T9SS type A sorting domain-containing protein [Flavobacteriales bacterium]|nr:T9SS type A sorting domain-containing protein [Flavobacteriales bacterium]
MLKNYLTVFLVFFFFTGKAQWGLRTINFENTEHLDTSLIQIDTAGCWMIGEPGKSILDSAFSLPNAIITDTLNPYAVNCNSAFTLKLDGYYCYQLDFKLKYDSELCKDGLVLEIKQDTGSAWINICDNPNYNYPAGGFYYVNGLPIADTCNLYNGETGITGTGNQHISMSIYSWVAIRGGWPDWEFRFRFVSDSVDTGQDGFMVDDVNVYQSNCPSSMAENEPVQLQIYPNPASTQLVLQSTVSLNGSAIIYDAAGKLVCERGIQLNTVDVSGLDAGLYTLVIESTKGFIAKRFLKI